MASNSIQITCIIPNTMLKKLKKIVDNIMEEDVNPQTLDFLFRYNSRVYPLSTHEILELPGEFEDIKDSAVFVINGMLNRRIFWRPLPKAVLLNVMQSRMWKDKLENLTILKLMTCSTIIYSS